MTIYNGIYRHTDLILKEVLVCQKDNNQKTRESAKVLLTLFVKRLALEDLATRLEAALGQVSVCVCVFVYVHISYFQHQS